MRLRPILAVAAATTAAVGLTAVPASAAAEPLVTGLAGPLSLSVDHGKVVVAQSFGGRLTRYGTDGSGGSLLLKRRPDVEISAVESRGPGVLAGLTGKTKAGKKFARIVRVHGDGSVTTVADMRGFEKRFNPDAHVTYGFRDISDSCANKLPKQLGEPSYTGIVDSHPYSQVRMPDGSIVVADAAGNDLVHVSTSGFRREIAVLPAQPLKVTAARAAGMHLPTCTVGHTYWFEPVPTDVERHGGLLYVSTLPGGPEDPSLGARGKVYTVDPRTGAVHRIGRGFAGATGLAVSPKGKVYVAELFGGAISTIKDGKATRVASVEMPAAVEWYHGKLYVSGGLQGPGYVTAIRP